MKATLSFLLALFSIIPLTSQSQQMIFEAEDPKADSSWFAIHESFCTRRIGKPFPLMATLPTIDGKSFDFGNLRQRTVVNLGFYGCHPCMHELPGFVQASKLHPEIDFVYLTFDAEKEIRREFSEAGLADFKPGPNYHILHLDRRGIDSLKLTNGYPTKYVLNTDGRIQKMMFSFSMAKDKNLKDQVEEFIKP